MIDVTSLLVSALRRKPLQHGWPENGYPGETLRAMRRKNGVGRPPKIAIRQREKAALNPVAIVRAAGVTVRRGDGRWIFQPPSNDRMKGRQYFTEHGWCYPCIFSTAALRKSKQRRGRA